MAGIVLRPKNPERSRFEKIREKQNCKRRRKRQSCDSSQSTRHRKKETNKEAQSSSTTRKQQKGKLKKVDMSTEPEDILDTFQSQNLAPAN